MKEQKSIMHQIDYTILFLLFILMCFSFLAIYSGSGQYYSNDPAFFVKRQVIWFIIGFIVMGVIMMIDYEIVKKFSYYFYGIGIFLLLLVSYSPLGIYKNGAQSWLNLGFGTFQPSEFMKIFLIMALAQLLSTITVNEGINNIKSDFKTVFKILAIALPPFLLILNEPDLGTAVVIASIIFTMVFMSGVSWKVLSVFASLVIVMIGTLVWLFFNLPNVFAIFIKDHQLERFYGWLKPWEYSSSYGYQLVEAIQAIGSGQLVGKGYLEGTQTQRNVIPELHTDFIFAVIGEEFGFIGAIILLITYFLLIYRMVLIGLNCKNLYGTYLIAGITGFLVCQIFENIGMTIGLMPITGLPLPFVSYGGTSLLTNMIAIGIVLNVGMRTRHYMFETEDYID
ncbi:rod shape-determining protein RodA [Anaerobacillus isosaccharinicus]|uniref:Rod shape-determining protein RodA n=1 Tax=Anaerobacillus isosaccharinicus TaxID=1532552 RepID=A0A1S2M766_9BACI|nr:rod shape-determining protein RodA [Anaerobacillus isosaccharinicus]MBA5585186.1 rod shape-determining protein RodA [Anaerobacillus isosaccharinicus]QOY36476.1 rod shape-determining protein RodA [Anaerobacillus isosaccharinicus]